MADSPVFIPASFADSSCGVAIDIGSALIKIIHVDKDPEEKDGLKRVTLTTFPAGDLPAALEFAQKYCNDNSSSIILCGSAARANEDAVSSKLGKSVKLIPRIDACVRAFVVGAQSFPRNRILLPFDLETQKLAEKLRVKVVAKMKEDNTGGRAAIPALQADPTTSLQPGESDKPMAEVENIFPCLLVIIGSGIDFIKVNDATSYELIDESARGGRLFSDLGTFMCGTKDYNELLTLAEKGRQQIPEVDMLPFSADMAPEKKAFALLLTLMKDIAMTASLEGSLAGVDHVFVAGSFVTQSIARDLLLREFTLRKMYRNKPKHIHFLKDNSHLGAIGSLVWK